MMSFENMVLFKMVYNNNNDNNQRVIIIIILWLEHGTREYLLDHWDPWSWNCSTEDSSEYRKYSSWYWQPKWLEL